MRKFEDGRTALGKEAIKQAFLDNLFYMQGKFPALATKNDYYMALAYAVRDRMLQRWISTAAAYTRHGIAHRRLPVGRVPDGAAPRQQPHQPRHLRAGRARQSTELGLDLDELLQQEEEPGLGNGGLGRLAACFLDSLATLEIPTHRLRHPLRVRHLRAGDRRRLAGREDRQVAALRQPLGDRAPGMGGGGQVRRAHRAVHRRARARCACAGCPHKIVIGVPYDTPILGYRINTANTLRLWRAEAPESFDFAVFNRGDYYGAVNQKIVSENITKVLYPNDEQLQRQGAAPGAAVLLRLLLAAGHAAHPARPEACRWSSSTRSSPCSSTTRIRRSPSPS